MHGLGVDSSYMVATIYLFHYFSDAYMFSRLIFELYFYAQWSYELLQMTILNKIDGLVQERRNFS